MKKQFTLSKSDTECLKNFFLPYKRIIVKVGSSLLINKDCLKIRNEWLNALSEDISWLQSFKKEIIIVSSGAIALGRSSFGAENKTLNLEENQAAAAIGQIELAYSWKAALEKFNLKCAQILLSPDDTETRRKHLNARATIAKLIEANIRGTITVSREGLNGSISGKNKNIQKIKKKIKNICKFKKFLSCYLSVDINSKKRFF